MINKFVKIIEEEGDIIYDIYVSSEDGLKILKNLCSELQLPVTDKNVLYKIFRNISNNKLKKTSRIKKELSKINPDIKEKINNYFSRRYNKSLSKLYDFWYSNEWIEVSSGRETDTERVENVIEWFMEYIIELSASLMDVYTMARFYRTYEWTGETPCIFYVGAKHKRNYEGFLYEEFDIDSIYSDSGTKQCVYVKKWI